MYQKGRIGMKQLDNLENVKKRIESVDINPKLWENILPVIRPWFTGLSGGREVFVNGFDHSSGYFIKRIGATGKSSFIIEGYS